MDGFLLEEDTNIILDLLAYMLWEDGYPCEQTLASLNHYPNCKGNKFKNCHIRNQKAIVLACKGHEKTLVKCAKHFDVYNTCEKSSTYSWDLILPSIILHLTTSPTLLSKLSHETKSTLQLNIELLINGLKKGKSHIELLINGLRKGKESHKCSLL